MRCLAMAATARRNTHLTVMIIKGRNVRLTAEEGAPLGGGLQTRIAQAGSTLGRHRHGQISEKPHRLIFFSSDFHSDSQILKF